MTRKKNNIVQEIPWEFRLSKKLNLRVEYLKEIHYIFNFLPNDIVNIVSKFLIDTEQNIRKKHRKPRIKF